MPTWLSLKFIWLSAEETLVVKPSEVEVEIEIPIDDDLFERVTRYAVSQGTTVEQLIREFLERFAREDPKASNT